MNIWLTGDTHGKIDINKLSYENWKESKNFKKDENILIILGDFGLLWKNIPDNEEKYWLKWLSNKPWITLFVDGNHENYFRLKQLKEIEMFGSKVGKVTDSIFHLRRGNIYCINNNYFFVMGGASSMDKQYRIEGLSWWKEELPNYREMKYGLDNLKKYNNEVDYILSHTGPQSIINKIDGIPYIYPGDSLTKYFDNLKDNINFKRWYFGHMHENINIDSKYFCIFDNIQLLKEN